MGVTVEPAHVYRSGKRRYLTARAAAFAEARAKVFKKWGRPHIPPDQGGDVAYEDMLPTIKRLARFYMRAIKKGVGSDL
jgi:hypothetical protein